MTSQIVHLIDDDAAVRHAVAFLLASSGIAVRAHESAPAFLEALSSIQPGCIITDIRMPGMSGLELQRELTARRIFLPVIVMTGHGDVPLAVQAMKAGAVDFIEKPFSDKTLLAAVQEAMARWEQDTARQCLRDEARTKLASLTPREREVLERLVDGLPNKSIAHELKISARTVEVHRANLMSKMGAHSLSELVRMALPSLPLDA
ncbi:response regulator FixJ [Acidocella sp.]|uniref:response regulator FixJ n=1 Tax=Acidocella sp. TaxID=50710 RepID=UPI003CFCB5D2